MLLSQSFRSLQLPPNATGPESIAFESGPVTGRFYVGIADGRILQYNGPRVGFLDFGFTGPNRNMRMGRVNIPIDDNRGWRVRRTE
ncbi:hypothetical protein V6N11_050658 [Hibiscus sabdariffa]|uniref:Uncharacterized protein n=1 Tax=Hibiscus sabdariffa TaxID=183260 RepID=A0ABR2TAG1_9ROSI